MKLMERTGMGRRTEDELARGALRRFLRKTRGANARAMRESLGHVLRDEELGAVQDEPEVRAVIDRMEKAIGLREELDRELLEVNFREGHLAAREAAGEDVRAERNALSRRRRRAWGAYNRGIRALLQEAG